MSRQRKPARIQLWRGNWTLRYFDPASGKEKRLSCATLGATTPEARVELVKQYRLREKSDAVEVVKRGGKLAFDTPLIEAIDRYLADVAERESVRKANPDGRDGLAEKSANMFRMTAEMFKDWLRTAHRDRLTTGDLDSATLATFFHYLAKTPTRQGNQVIRRSTATLNTHRRNIRAALYWLADVRPAMFPDPTGFKRALKPVAGDTAPPSAFSPQSLAKFLATALDREDEGHVVTVQRYRSRVVIPTAEAPLKGRHEQFTQAAPAKAQTPISALFLMLALTGCRLGEALALRWTDVDLQRGRITIRAKKTGRTRIVPLIGAPEGIIAPRFLELLKRWRMQAADREFVLPTGDSPEPAYCKSGWQLTNAAAKLPRLGPQMLRQNFCAYAASLGVPATVAAMWQGHGANVAERWYRAQVLDRADGETFEDAMGLRSVIDRIIAEGALAAPRLHRHALGEIRL